MEDCLFIKDNHTDRIGTIIRPMELHIAHAVAGEKAMERVVERVAKVLDVLEWVLKAILMIFLKSQLEVLAKVGVGKMAPLKVAHPFSANCQGHEEVPGEHLDLFQTAISSTGSSGENEIAIYM